MTSFDSGFGNDSERPPTPHGSPLERGVQVVSIAGGIVAIIAGILSFLKGGQAYLIWIVVAVAVLLIGTTIYKPLHSRLREWSERRKDRIIAKLWFPKFQIFIRRFGSFVNNGTNDTLHAIIQGGVSDAVRPDLTLCLGPTPIDLWYHMWFYLSRRVEQQRPSLLNLQCDVQEFQFLAGQYFNLCVTPIFTSLSNEARRKLSEQDKSRLNGFQQRHAHFITEYTVFIEELVKSSPSLQSLPRFLSQANPL